MASNISSGDWRVKIISIPAPINIIQLSQIIGLPRSHIYLSKVNDYNTHYAWINGFVSEEEATKFARKWSGESTLGEIIGCIVAPPRSVEKEDLHSSHESLVSAIETSSNKPEQQRPTSRPVFKQGEILRQFIIY